MTPLTTSIDVGRPQEEVFAYVTDPSRFSEWQMGVLGGSMEDGPATGVGSRCITTRRIGGTLRDINAEVTRLDPPDRGAIRGIDGPIRATVEVTVEPLAGPSRSRVFIAIDFDGHGIGRLLVPLIVRRQARSEMPKNCQMLRRGLESAPAPSTG